MPAPSVQSEGSGSSSSPTDGNREAMWVEYKVLCDDLTRYDLDGQRILSILTLVVALAFAIGYKDGIDAVFVALPFFVFIVAQLMTAHDYAYGVRFVYLVALEAELQRSSGGYPQLYSGHLTLHYRRQSPLARVALPINGAMALTVVPLFAMALLGAFRGMGVIQDAFNSSMAVGYGVSCLATAVYVALSWVWSRGYLRDIASVSS